MTSADVREIISSIAPVSTPAPKKSGASTKKPEGISRELYSLIGNAAPTLVAQVARPRFKQRPDLGRARVHWEWKPFAHPARKDSLKLSHWAKGDDNGEYPFGRYNIDTNVLSYTDEEYTTLLNDGEWTKEDTDYLFGLVRAYDQRFVVIADRYNAPSGVERAIEDLKARYYGVCRILLDHRITAEDPTKPQTLANYAFDKDQEKARLAYVSKLYSKAPEQVKEEEALYVEIKRLEQTERRFTKEREDLLRMLAGVESGLSGLRMSEEGPDDGKKRRRQSGMTAESPFTPGMYGTSRRAKEQHKQQIADDQLHCITRTDSVLAGHSNKSNSHTHAYLRSTRIPVPKPGVAAKVTSLLSELGISADKLVMPTRTNIERLESLLNTATALVEMKKAVDREEHEIRVLKGRSAIGEADDDVEMIDDPGLSRKRSLSESSPQLANKRQRKE